MIILEKILSIYIKLFITLSFFGSTFLYAGQKDIYNFKWLDQSKKVYVLQDKIHENKGRVYLNVGYGSSELSKFNSTTNLHGNLGVYMGEEWALEGFFSNYTNKNNDAYEAINVQIKEQTGRDVFPHVVKIKQMYGLNLMYSPFYGKINTFNKIFYLDWSFGIGGAMSKYEHNTELIQAALGTFSTDTYEDGSAISGLLKTQLRWHLNKTFKVNLDFVNYFTKLPDLENLGGSFFNEKEKFIRSYDIMISAGLMF